MAENSGNKSDKLKNFTPAYDILLAKYGPMTAVIYGYIWRRSQGERKRCDSNRKTIKKFLHIDEKTFTTHARKLAQDGYVRFQERGNASTLYWTTGKAEKDNANFSVEIFPTKRNSSEEILHATGEILPDAEEIFPGSEEILPTQQGNFPYEESIYESTKESIKDSSRREERESPSPETASVSLSDNKNHPAINLWLDVVKPLRLTQKEKDEIILHLGDDPDKEKLIEAHNDWCARVDNAGRGWSKTNIVPIIERYEAQKTTKQSKRLGILREAEEENEYQDQPADHTNRPIVVDSLNENGEKLLVWSDGSISDAHGENRREHPAVSLWIEVVKPVVGLVLNSKQKLIEKLGNAPNREALEKAVSEWRDYAKDKKNKKGKPYSLSFIEGILERYDAVISNPEPLKYYLDESHYAIYWSDGKEETIADDGSFFDRNARMVTYAGFLAKGEVRYKEYAEGAWRFERTLDNEYIKRKAVDGDEKKEGDLIYVLVGKKWELKDGQVQLNFLQAYKTKCVDISHFRTVENHQWRPSTIEEASLRLQDRNTFGLIEKQGLSVDSKLQISN